MPHIHSLLTISPATTLDHAFIISPVNYINILLTGLSAFTLNPTNFLLHKAATNNHSKFKSDHDTPLLIAFHDFPFHSEQNPQFFYVIKPRWHLWSHVLILPSPILCIPVRLTSLFSHSHLRATAILTSRWTLNSTLESYTSLLLPSYSYLRPVSSQDGLPRSWSRAASPSSLSLTHLLSFSYVIYY